MATHRPTLFNRLTQPLVEMFGLSRALALTVVLLVGALLVLAFFWFFYSAPPHTVTITSGVPGSSFASYAEKYREILARKGITLEILPSEGSLQNLQRLGDPALDIDIGLVQGGITNGPSAFKLVSLGSISYQPLLVFYHGSNSLNLLSQLKGQRLDIGPVGSGTRALALTLLSLNVEMAGQAAHLVVVSRPAGRRAGNARGADSPEARAIAGPFGRNRAGGEQNESARLFRRPVLWPARRHWLRPRPADAITG